MPTSFSNSTRALVHGIGQNLLSPLVLVDVGASLSVHQDFLLLREFSSIIAFDADSREIPSSSASNITVVNKAVVPRNSIVDGKVKFTLTANPTLSSTLEPNDKVAASYSLARRLDPIGTVLVPAVTLVDAVRHEGLGHIDWLKLDTQGTDGRLVQSLPSDMLARLLCVDVEPGVHPFYVGEDTFDAVHAAMQVAGFWLAKLDSIDAARISRKALTEILPNSHPILETAVDISLSSRYRSPVAVNARYLREPDHVLRTQGSDGLKRLWLCAMACDLIPFAFEVAGLLNKTEAVPEHAELLSATRILLRRRMIAPMYLARKLSIGRIKRALNSHF